MKPEELKKEIDNLKSEINKLNGLLNRVGDTENVDTRPVTDANITISTSIGAGGGTVNHVEFPDRWEVVKIKGTAYVRPLYLTTRL